MTKTSLGIARAKEQQTTIAEQRLKDMIKYLAGASGQGSGTQVVRAGLTQEQQRTAEDIAVFANRFRHGTVTAETATATAVAGKTATAAKDEREAAAASIATYANRRQRTGRSRGPMASFSAR